MLVVFKRFRVLLATSWKAIMDMRDFLVLLVSYLTICSLLSTEIFAYKVQFHKTTGLPLVRSDNLE